MERPRPQPEKISGMQDVSLEIPNISRLNQLLDVGLDADSSLDFMRREAALDAEIARLPSISELATEEITKWNLFTNERKRT